MVSQIGSLALSIASGLILSTFFFLIYYRLTKDKIFIDLSERSIIATCLSIFLATICLLNELLISNFNLQYVAQYTSYETPMFYKVTSLWAGQAGSLLFWTFIMSVYTLIYIFFTLNKIKVLKYHSYFIFAIIFGFFLFLSNFIANPFEPVSPDIIVQNGNGLNPLLQNVTMAIHPPILYLGFIGTTILFVMTLSALIVNEINYQWVKSIRSWALIVWTFLSAGIILGGYWAYQELGWGGYWAWDPVENSSLMPWFLLTAFIHSSIIQEKRGLLKTWNVLLASLTYIFVILGTFITRSGIISSVHSFTAESLGPLFFVFLCTLILLTVFWFFKHYHMLVSEEKIKSFTSREGGFLYNNLILVTMCFIVLWGTLFPIISEAWNGEKIHIGQNYFNQLNVPIGIFLLFLMGIGPLLSWKKTSSSTLISNFKIPMISSFITGSLYMVFTDEFRFYPFVTLLGIIFTLTAISIEFKKSFDSHYSKDSSFFRAILNLLSQNRHKNGGYIVHIGITLLFVGFVGRAFEKETEFVLKPDEQFYFANYNFRLNSVTTEQRNNHLAAISNMDVTDESNNYITTLYPEKRIYFYRDPDTEKHQPHSELDIYSTMNKDIYSVFSSYDSDTKEAYFKIMINPLVNWVWIGGIMIVLGSLFAFWPSSSRRD